MSTSKTGYVLSFGVSPPAVILVDDDASKPSFMLNFKKCPGVPDEAQLNLAKQVCVADGDSPTERVIFVYFKCGDDEDALCPKEDINSSAINFKQEFPPKDEVWTAGVGFSSSNPDLAYFRFTPPADFKSDRKDYGVSFTVSGFTPPVGKSGTVMFSSVPVNFTDVDPVACNAGLDKRFKVRVESFRLGQQEWVPGQELLPVDFGVTEELSWKVLNADNCSLRDGFEEKPVGLEGTRRVVIDSPKVFTLNATRYDSSTCASIQAKLNSPKIEFSADKTEVEPGEMVMLKWKVTSANKVFLSSAPKVSLEKEGTCTVEPLVDTTYTLTASGYDGTKYVKTTESVDITVAKPEIKEFSADRLYVRPEDEVVLHWEVKSAAKITITPTVGEVRKNVVSCVVKPYTNTEYIITAFGHDGNPLSTVTKSALVTVALSKWEKIGNTNILWDSSPSNCRISSCYGYNFVHSGLNKLYSTRCKNDLSDWGFLKIVDKKPGSTTISTILDAVHYRAGNFVVFNLFSINELSQTIYYCIEPIENVDDLRYYASLVVPGHPDYYGASVRINKPIETYLPSGAYLECSLLLFVSSKDKLYIYGFLHPHFDSLSPPTYRNAQFSLLKSFSFSFRLDGVDVVCFRGGLLLAVRDRDSRKITFYSVGEDVVKGELTCLDTYSGVVDGWFRLFVVNGEAYLLYRDAVVMVSVNPLQRVSPVPPQMVWLPYTGVVNGVFFVITEDKVIWKFKP